MPFDPALEAIEKARHLELSALRDAVAFSEEELREYQQYIEAECPAGEFKDVEVLLFGSVARGDAGDKSDCDYLVVVNSIEALPHTTKFLAAMKGAIQSKGVSGPGGSGLFGTFASSTDLVGRIGLEADSNSSTTRRVLCLVESTSAYAPEVRAGLMKALVHRYFDDYRLIGRNRPPETRVPHFLMNDLTRYWWTMAVDFGAKRWQDGNTTQYLRRFKLLTTRKVLFAGSVAAAFAVHLRERDEGEAEAFLLGEFNKPPVARLAGLYDLVSDVGKEAICSVVVAYDEVVSLLRTDKTRIEQLEKNPDKALEEKVDALQQAIRGGLDRLFFEDATLLPLTRRYLVF